MTRTASRV